MKVLTKRLLRNCVLLLCVSWLWRTGRYTSRWRLCLVWPRKYTADTVRWRACGMTARVCSAFRQLSRVCFVPYRSSCRLKWFAAGYTTEVFTKMSIKLFLLRATGRWNVQCLLLAPASLRRYWQFKARCIVVRILRAPFPRCGYLVKVHSPRMIRQLDVSCRNERT
jgi:hypothetical protein